MKTVYLSLGSNLGDREQSLQQAIDLLRGPNLAISRCSSVYETEPQDVRNQPWFLNLVLEVSTGLMPRQLLSRIQSVEKQLGRRRGIPKGPRIIDIDILLFGRFVIDAADLVVPHPGLTERRFVLEPLAELAPDLRHPVLKKTMRELLGAVGTQALRKVEFRPEIPGA